LKRDEGVLMLFVLAMAATLAVPFDAATRATLPPAAATLVAHGSSQRCTGVWLRDLLAKAGVPAGEAIKGPLLHATISVVAADGYRVGFSLGEIDAKLGNTPILVADACDGKPLPVADGPLRLVAEGEMRAARSVRQVTAIEALLP
jgi:hypothetical protein